MDEASLAKDSKRRRKTRGALLAAGHKLMAARSIDALAIDDIVQEAGVAKGSFYNHFEGKDDFATTIRDEIRSDVEASIKQVNAGVEDPARRVVRSVSIYVNYILESAERASVMRRLISGSVSADSPLNEGVVSDITAGLRSGRFIVPSVQAGALFVMGACQISLMEAAEEPSRAVTITITQQLCALLLRGLGLAFGEAELLSAQAVHEVYSPSGGSLAGSAPQGRPA